MIKPLKAGQVVTRVISGESFDLYLLAASAFACTILGVAGVSSLADLASLILGLLAALALSQARSRRQVMELAAAQRTGPLSLLSTVFPAELAERRAAAADLLLIGMTMSRFIQGAPRDDLRRVLLRGGRIRVLLLDPSDDELLARVTRGQRSVLTQQRLKTRVLGALDELTSLRDSTGGRLEVRVTSLIPTAGFTVVDSANPGGCLVVQHYEHKLAEDAGPVISLEREHGFWFDHFTAEAERMWADGAAWPLSPVQALERAPHLVFRESFGSELEYCLRNARELLITGIARNTLLNSNYGSFESLLRGGCRIRVLLLDPAADAAVHFAADRYYAERSAATLRERIGHSLRLLDTLERKAKGRLSVRLTAHPLSAGLIAADSTPPLRSAASAAFLEYYTYRAAAAEPKIALTPEDAPWYSNVLGEAEALWASAADHCG